MNCTPDFAARIDHFNINVTDSGRSEKFYAEALGMKVLNRKSAADGSFTLAYLGTSDEDVRLELTWLRDHPQPYELGENEIHIAFRVDDYEKAHAHHEKMGVICYENPAMGIYFIEDPDGYWLEILPPR